MSAQTKDTMRQDTQMMSQTEQNKVCLNKDDGAWYSVGSVICKHGRDWECQSNGKFSARNSSDSCTF